jgi:transposase
VLVLDNATCHTARIVRQFLDEISDIFQVIWLPQYSPELNDIERIWKYVKGASLANFYFGDAETLRQAISEVFNKLNSESGGDLSLRFRDPISKYLLKVA